MATHFVQPSLILLWPLFLGLWEASGFVFEQSLVLEANGGLKASLVYEVPNDAVGLLSGFHRVMSSRVGPTTNGGFLDEKAVRAQFSGIQGVYVESYARYQLEEKQRVELSVVALDAAAAFASGAFGPFRFGQKSEDAGWSLELEMPATRAYQEVDNARATRLAELLGGFRVTLTITTPTAVQSGSTGREVGPNRRQWEIGLEDLLKRALPEVRVIW